MTKRTRITVQDRVAELVAEHGSYRAAAEAAGLSLDTLWQIAHRPRNNLRESTAKAMGLDVVYFKKG